MRHPTMKIGIFWIFKGKIIGKARDLSEGLETIPGRINSPDGHVDLWENDPAFEIPLELRDSEYQDVPRGRVMYATDTHQAIVYLDDVLMSEDDKKRITDFFELGEMEIIWKTDPHYTTRPQRIDRLFEE